MTCLTGSRYLAGVGCHIDDFLCCSWVCRRCSLANKRLLQLLVDIAVDFSSLERFLLQPVKSVILQILQYARRSPQDGTVATMKEQAMPIVEEAMHVGVLRFADTQEHCNYSTIFRKQDAQSTASWNENGLDPETSKHLLQPCILSVLDINLYEIHLTGLMCKEEPETVDHFLIWCNALVEMIQLIMDSILRCAEC